MNENVKNLEILAMNIRKNILDTVYSFGAGHIGGSMSMAELMAVLYGLILKINPENPRWDGRDWLVVSKGHCGPAVYATLAQKGFFPKEWLSTLNKPGTNLPSHCDRNRTPGIDMTTGSLGQGLSVASGIAWGHRYKNNGNMTYCILGDGELNEGQVWEAALFASSKKLSNLIAFVDENHKQLDGYTKNICDLGSISGKFREFGWNTQEVDGHSIEQIIKAIAIAQKPGDKPNMIVLDTVKGKHCPFVENEYYNHHVTINKNQYDESIQHLDYLISQLQSEVSK